MPALADVRDPFGDRRQIRPAPREPAPLFRLRSWPSVGGVLMDPFRAGNDHGFNLFGRPLWSNQEARLPSLPHMRELQTGVSSLMSTRVHRSAGSAATSACVRP
jgi:hypothetical protein